MASTGSNSSIQEADRAAERADIVVGLTAYNDAKTAGAVAGAVRDGLARYFGSSATRIVLADAGSTDGTPEAVRASLGAGAALELEFERHPALGDLPYHGHPGHLEALRAVLEAAQRLGAKACAVVDASVHAAQPEWVERLVAPLLGGDADYVSPHFARHAFEGALTRSIVYPLFRALYGVRLRQPAAGEFGCSAHMAAHFLGQDFWEREHAPAAIHLWLAAAAAAGGFRVCEAPLGTRAAAARGTPADLGTTVAQLVGALFEDLEHRVDVWQRVRASSPVPVVGAMPAVQLEAPPLNVEGLVEQFRLGYRELREIWTFVLPPRTIVELRRLTEAGPGALRIDDRLWASIVYDFALGHAFRVMPRDHLLRSLTPLYAGWLASFALHMQGATQEQIDARIEQVCQGFEAEKRYLISRWRWPERMR